MTTTKNAVIIGGHGKVARLATTKLHDAGFSVSSLIRNPDQESDVREAGAEPVILDLESADTDQLTSAFEGADVVVFVAGAGGGDPQRTMAVDRDAAVRTIDAAKNAAVSRYVLLSYCGSSVDFLRVDEKDSFYPYTVAKHDADRYLRESGLTYTILAPGLLTNDPGSGRIVRIDPAAAADVEPQGTSRDNVAEIISEVATNGTAANQTVTFFDGDTPIEVALRDE